MLKPIGPLELLDSIVTILGRTKSQTQQDVVSRQTPPVNSPEHHLRILVAEDNPINQLLARRILEKAGHTVVVADNGEEALSALNREAFDFVLMDVQMPVMDGFQATERIRQQEIASGKHQWIVAMTAHALVGDRDRCLAAGMDDYLTKPIRNSELFDALSKCGASDVPPSSVLVTQLDVPEAGTPGDATLTDPIAVSSPERTSNKSVKQHSQPISSERPLEFEYRFNCQRQQAASDDPLAGDPDLRRELAAMFLEDCPKLLSEVRAAVTARDGPSLKRAAHTLKGSVGVFKFQSAFDAVLRMEHVGNDSDWAHAEEVLETVDGEMAVLKAMLTDIARTQCDQPSLKE